MQSTAASIRKKHTNFKSEEREAVGVERPSDNQPEATKILSSSQLVQTLATRLIMDTDLL